MKPEIELSRKWVDCSTIAIIDSADYDIQPDVLVLEVKMYLDKKSHYIVINSPSEILGITTRKKQWIVNSNTLGVTSLTTNLLEFKLGIFEITACALYKTTNVINIVAGTKVYTYNGTLPKILVVGRTVYKTTKNGLVWELDSIPLVSGSAFVCTIDETKLYVPSLLQYERQITTIKDCDYTETARSFAILEALEYSIACGKLEEAYECIKTLKVEDCDCLDFEIDGHSGTNEPCGCI